MVFEKISRAVKGEVWSPGAARHLELLMRSRLRACLATGGGRPVETQSDRSNGTAVWRGQSSTVTTVKEDRSLKERLQVLYF